MISASAAMIGIFALFSSKTPIFVGAEGREPSTSDEVQNITA